MLAGLALAVPAVGPAMPPASPAVLPASCSAILRSGGSVGDGVYTIDPAQNLLRVRVYCDMTTAGGGWTLAGYGADANLGGPLFTANGVFDPTGRSGAANIDAFALARSSTEVALSWSDTAAHAGLQSYEQAVRYRIPHPGAQTLAPPDGARACSDPAWTQVAVEPLVGSPNLPTSMYTQTGSLGASYGSAYGLVRNSGNPRCDWTIDGQPFTAVYLGIDSGALSRGVVTEPGGIESHVIPATMAIWFRDGSPVVTLHGRQGSYGLLDTVGITCTATDNAQRAQPCTVAGGTGPAYTFRSTNSVTGKAVDAAGDVGTVTKRFRVEATYGSLCAVTVRLVAAKRPRGELCSLLRQARAARAARKAEQEGETIRDYIGRLAALVEQRSLTRSRASSLARWARTVAGVNAVAPAHEVAVVPDGGVLPWASARHDGRLELLLGTIASTIAGRPVAVRCHGPAEWATLASPEVVGFVGDSTGAELGPGACKELQRFAAASPKPTRCRGTGRTAGPLGPCYLGSGRWVTNSDADRFQYGEIAQSVITLAHEAIHLQQQRRAGYPARPEWEAECFGMQWVPHVAQRLGAGADDAQMIAVYLYDTSFAKDRDPDCAPGKRGDLTPGDGIWP